MHRTILCYGDSNTWGSIASWTPATLPSTRYNAHIRWPGALADTLGNEYTVIEEGLSGRTTVYAEPDEPYKNGKPYLLPCILSHRPLDLVIFMLGTNDLKLSFGIEDARISEGMAKLIDIVQRCWECGVGNVAPRILLISPIHIIPPQGRQDFYMARGEEAAVTRAKLFAQAYRKLAEEKQCFFLDAAAFADPDPADGMHLTRESHPALGMAVANKVIEIFQTA